MLITQISLSLLSSQNSDLCLHFQIGSLHRHGSRIGHIRIPGIGLELACNGGSCGGISLKRVECNLHLKRLPRISLTCKLVPVRYREYEYGLLQVRELTWKEYGRLISCLQSVP